MALPVDALQADATAPDGMLTVPLCGVELQVLPTKDWRSSAVTALRAGNFDPWAQKCLTPASWASWQDIDPTVGEVDEFFAAFAEVTGQAVGESAASPRSSRSTARRSRRT